MLRFFLYTALALNFSPLAVTATDRYGAWLLEQPRSSMRTLSFKQSVQLNNKIETLELGFICDQRKNSKSVGVILIPFDGTFQSDQEVIPVLIQKNADQYVGPSDLLQKWKDGAEYIFLEAKDDVDELASRSVCAALAVVSPARSLSWRRSRNHPLYARSGRAGAAARENRLSRAISWTAAEPGRRTAA